MSKLASSFRSELIRSGCGAAAFFMAVALFAGAQTVVDVPLFAPPFDKVAHFTLEAVTLLIRKSQPNLFRLAGSLSDLGVR